jgi:hypothetical protein
MSLPARDVPVESFSFPLFRGTDFTCLKNCPVQFPKVAIKGSPAIVRRSTTQPHQYYLSFEGTGVPADFAG